MQVIEEMISRLSTFSVAATAALDALEAQFPSKFGVCAVGFPDKISDRKSIFKTDN